MGIRGKIKRLILLFLIKIHILKRIWLMEKYLKMDYKIYPF